MRFLDFVTVFNQSYKCQTSHCLGRNQVFRSFMIFLCYNSLHMSKGSFKNYVDHFLSYFDHLPTLRLLWTFGALPTLCLHGDRKTYHPLAYVNLTIHTQFYSFTEQLANQPISIICISKICLGISKINHCKTVFPNSKQNFFM